MHKLTSEQVQKALNELPGWSLNPAGEIAKTFRFRDFPQALMFVMSVGWLAEAAQHHPDITIQWNRVTLALTTHDAGGLTDKDVALAKQVEALLASE